jgi:hypothetical protein
MKRLNSSHATSENTDPHDSATGTTAEDDVASATGGTADDSCSYPPVGEPTHSYGGRRAQLACPPAAENGGSGAHAGFSREWVVGIWIWQRGVCMACRRVDQGRGTATRLACASAGQGRGRPRSSPTGKAGEGRMRNLPSGGWSRGGPMVVDVSPTPISHATSSSPRGRVVTPQVFSRVL